MVSREADWHDRFMRHIMAWSWPFFFRQLQAKDLLVIDRDIRNAFEDKFDTLKCRTASPENAFAAIDQDVKRMFVLCREGEWRLVKAFKAKYPRRPVYSCTYQVAPRSLFGKPVMARKNEVDETPLRRPLVLISTPYSDAEYLAQILELNGLASPKEYLDRTLATWLGQMEGFQLSRYFNEVQNLHQADGVFDLHLQTDVLATLLDRSNAGWHSLTKWLKRNDAQIIYFTRRDKMAQTGFGAVLDRTRFRSVWRMSEMERKGFRPKRVTSFAAANEWLQQTINQEAELETYLGKTFDNFRMVTLEELVESPVEVLKSLTISMGERAPDGFKVPNYQAPYHDLPNLWDSAVKFRHELIDRLGLHVNAAGSMVTYTDSIVKAEK